MLGARAAALRPGYGFVLSRAVGPFGRFWRSRS
jgi:hypothetical protein